MIHVDTWVVGFYGAIHARTLHVSAYHVVAHLQWNNLLVVEYILYHNDRSTAIFVGLLVGIIFLLSVSEFRYTYSNTKLLSAFRTLEYQ